MRESTRSLPPDPSLEQLRKQAKELLRELRAGDEEARRRFRAQLPDKATHTLADAQFVLACEYGFEKWTSLKAHVEGGGGIPPALEEAFRRAFGARDAGAVRALLLQHPSAGVHIDAPVFPFDSPALVHFVDDPDLVEVLLEFGADPNRRTDWWAGGFHALHSTTGAVADRLIAAGAVPDACAAANLDRPELLRHLLDAEATRVHERGGDGQTPLHFARSRAVVDLLLERGADLDARDVDHRSTPAQWMLDRAPGKGRYDLARYLVDRGATADVFLASALGLTDRLRALLDADRSLLELRTGQGEYGTKPPASYHIYFWTIGPNLSPLQVAAQFGQAGALEVLSAAAGPKHRFLDACVGARAEEAKALLSGRPLLMRELTAADQRALADAAWEPNPPAVALMVELGFDPAAPGHDGGSALHCAAWVGSIACVRSLLRYEPGRALVGARDATYGATPLGWCVHGAEHCTARGADYPTVARLLLEAGATPDPGWESAPEAVRAVIRDADGAV